MKTKPFTKQFKQAKGDEPYTACKSAVAWLAERGYSVGPEQAKLPMGIMKGVHVIRWWGEMTQEEASKMHGIIAGNKETGPVQIRIKAEFAPYLAYLVQGDEYGTLVFSRHSATARRQGANELDIEWEQVQSCVRAPGLDKYHGKGLVPLMLLVKEYGWWAECAWCNHHIDADDLEVSAELAKPVMSESTGVNYCCVQCEALMENRRRQWAAEEQAKREIESKAMEQARGMWPEITDVNAHTNNIGHCTVQFKFPGSARLATWQMGATSINVAPCDVLAWETYRGRA